MKFEVEMPDICKKDEIFKLDIQWILGKWHLVAIWRCDDVMQHKAMGKERQFRTLVGPASPEVVAKLTRR